MSEALFLAFVGEDYYPEKGIGNCVGVYTTLGDAVARCEAELVTVARPDDYWAQVAALTADGAAVVREWNGEEWLDPEAFEEWQERPVPTPVLPAPNVGDVLEVRVQVIGVDGIPVSLVQRRVVMEGDPGKSAGWEPWDETRHAEVGP